MCYNHAVCNLCLISGRQIRIHSCISHLSSFCILLYILYCMYYLRIFENLYCISMFKPKYNDYVYSNYLLWNGPYGGDGGPGG